MMCFPPLPRHQRPTIALLLGAAIVIGLLPGCSATDKALAAVITPKSNPTPLPSADAADAANTRKLYLILVSDLEAQGKSRAALGYLAAYDKFYPNDPKAALLRAQCLLDIGSYQAATSAFRAQLNSGNAAAAHNGLGQVAMAQRHWQDAVDQFNAADTADPSNVRYINNLSYAQLRAGQFDQAVSNAREAYELAPGNNRVRNNLLLALAAAGNKSEAQSLIDAIGDPAQRAAVQHMVTTQLMGLTNSASS